MNEACFPCTDLKNLLQITTFTELVTWMSVETWCHAKDDAYE